MMFVQLQPGIVVHELLLHDSVIINELSLFDIPFMHHFSNVVALNHFLVESYSSNSTYKCFLQSSTYHILLCCVLLISLLLVSILIFA